MKNVETRGMVRFRYYPFEEFRFAVKIYATHGIIWLESRKSKQQWECKLEGEKAILGTCSMTLPRDTVLSCVADALNRPSPVVTADLVRLENDSQLYLVVPVAVGLPTSTAKTILSKYSFSMKLLHLDRVDVLASQVRELEETVKELQQELANVKGQQRF